MSIHLLSAAWINVIIHCTCLPLVWMLQWVLWKRLESSTDQHLEHKYVEKRFLMPMALVNDTEYSLLVQVHTFMDYPANPHTRRQNDVVDIWLLAYVSIIHGWIYMCNAYISLYVSKWCFQWKWNKTLWGMKKSSLLQIYVLDQRHEMIIS